MSKEDVEEILESFHLKGKITEQHADDIRNILTPLVASKPSEAVEELHDILDEFLQELEQIENSTQLGEVMATLKFKLTPLVAQTHTPTVKEESHTQEWETQFEQTFPLREIEGKVNEDTWFGTSPTPTKLKAFINEVASQEYQRGALYNHEGTFTRGFEAGRLQGIAKALEYVRNMKTSAPAGKTFKYRVLTALTALEVIKNKK